jgi:hypothetical protein
MIVTNAINTDRMAEEKATDRPVVANDFDALTLLGALSRPRLAPFALAQSTVVASLHR